MPAAKKTLFTIGQFAALHGINKKTLMWYDEIGLFRPAAIDEENGYRYYNYYQSSLLETILMLRDLNVPLNEIRAFMENRSAAGMERLMQAQIGEADRSIARLKAIRRTLSLNRQDMLSLLNLDVSEISVVEKKQEYLVTVETAPGLPFEKEIEMMVGEIKKYNLPRMYNASYGSMIAAADLYAGKFENYTKLFMKIPHALPSRGLHRQPGGTYLRAYCKGSWDKLPARYEQLLHYADKQGLTLTGWAYEMGINETVIDTMEDYITRIEIPVIIS